MTSDSPHVSEVEVRGIVVGLFQENCWIIGNRRSSEAICIDPGDQADDILHLAGEMGFTIKCIANSHAHLDHILGVRAIQAKTGAPFLLHQADLPIAHSVTESALRFGIHADPPPEPDHLLTDGDLVEVEGLTLRAFHTPGHTPGSLCYYTDRLLFSGDTLFRGSIGRTDLPGGNHRQELDSILDKLFLLPPDTVVLPGHMEETTIAAERATNPHTQKAARERETRRTQ